jgi:hypothetical protein
MAGEECHAISDLPPAHGWSKRLYATARFVTGSSRFEWIGKPWPSFEWSNIGRADPAAFHPDQYFVSLGNWAIDFVDFYSSGTGQDSGAHFSSGTIIGLRFNLAQSSSSSSFALGRF